MQSVPALDFPMLTCLVFLLPIASVPNGWHTRHCLCPVCLFSQSPELASCHLPTFKQFVLALKLRLMVIVF